jgi:hypothetical protein
MSRSCNTLGEKGNVYRVLLEKPEERDCMEGLGMDGRIILRWI